jgi:RNA polymerase sigma factor (sigma-70 family)
MYQAEEDLLVMAAQNGNHKAFSILFRRYQTPLLRFSYKLSKDSELAKDAVQDAWIKSAANLRKLQDPRAFKSWVYRQVRWRTIDLLRKQTLANDKFEPLNEGENDVLIEETINEDNALSEVVKLLPLIEKQIIDLFYLDEMKLAEMAIILELPLGTIKSRLHRARNLLKQKFETIGECES